MSGIHDYIRSRRDQEYKRGFLVGLFAGLVIAATLSSALGAEIVGPDRVDTGKIGVYTVKHDGPADAAITWRITQLEAFWDFDRVTTAGVFHVTSRSGGKFEIEAEVTNWDTRTREQVTKRISIGDSPIPPTPPPGPTPPTPPDPPTPTPLTDLGKKVKEWTASSPVMQRSLLANSFADTANVIETQIANAKAASVPPPSIEECKALCLQSNRKALGETRSEWVPFGMKLDKELAGLSITTAEKCVTVYREIAAGLGAN